MTLLLLEALCAGLLFIGIIWWTMFSGRKHGELPDAARTHADPVSTTRADPEPAARAEDSDKNTL